MPSARPIGLLFALLGFLGGCTAGGDITRPVPRLLVPAPRPAHRLVVMLPGRVDGLDDLARRGIAPLIQRQWPDADVLLVGLTMPFYRQGRAPERLHDEVVAPALARHAYDQVWMAGISLGGLGTLLYDRAYPGQLDGLLLLSPYLGDPPIAREIRQAGGVRRWSPGPAQPMTAATFQRELWRHIRHWADEPARTRSVWLAYGSKERFRERIELMAPLLPPGHVVMLPGHHNWSLWTPAARTLLERASAAPAVAAGARADRPLSRRGESPGHAGPPAARDPARARRRPQRSGRNPPVRAPGSN